MNAKTALSAVEQKFVLHWGEMGLRWGVNRTVAQIHAMLFLSQRPMHAEEIQELLTVARSNVSNSLKDLQSWGIVKRVHVLADRRDHFEAMKDVWEMFRIVVEERKKREIDPTLVVLRECVVEAHKDKSTAAYSIARLEEMLGFFETTTRGYDQVKSWPLTTLTKLAGMGDRLRKLLGIP